MVWELPHGEGLKQAIVEMLNKKKVCMNVKVCMNASKKTRTDIRSGKEAVLNLTYLVKWRLFKRGTTPSSNNKK